MNKFNLSKGLLDTVSGIVTSSKKQQVEQNTQFVSAMKEKTKIESIKPLTAEQLASVPKREPKDLGLHNAIKAIASQSAVQAAAEQQTAEGRINSMYRTSGGRGRSLAEAKAKLDPVGKEDADVNNDKKVDSTDSYLKNRRKAVSAAIKNEEVESVEEGWDDMLKDVKDRAKPQPNGGSGMKKGTRYGGANQKDEKDEKKETNEGVLGTIKKYAKKAVNKLGHGSDEDLIKDLQKKAGVPQTGKKPVKEEVELEEAVKIGSKVKIHAPGKDYHDQVGRVGEIRHGAFKGAAKTYTVDYAGKSIQLDKKNVKLHKEDVEHLDEAEGIVRHRTDSGSATVSKTGVKFNNSGYKQEFTHAEISKMDSGKTVRGFRNAKRHPYADADTSVYTDGDEEHHLPKKAKVTVNEGIDQLEEGSMNNMTLSQLKSKHEHHFTSNNQNYPGAENDVDDDPDRMEKHAKASKAIEDHVANAYGRGARRSMVAASRRKVKEIHKSLYNEDIDVESDMESFLNQYLGEDVGQIDEISTTKKLDYIDAASVSTARLGNTLGRLQGSKTSAETQKTISKKISNRIAGITRAARTIKTEAMDTPGNGYEHQCAVHVKHAKLGEGKTLFSQHADPAEDGTIAWYDVMFEHGIEKNVPTTDLEIVVSESHMNHKKKK